MKKKLARILAFALTAVMLVAQLPYALAADTSYCSICGENGVKGALQHTIAPTCGKDGFKIYACSNGNCKGTITVKVLATGVHTADGNTVAEVPATCTATGTKAYQLCTGCGCYLEPGTQNKLESIVIPANGHSYTNVVTPPTCTDEGYTTHTCSVCNYSYVDTKVEALGHDYSVTVPAKQATCKEEGYTEYIVCSRCGAEDPDHKKVVLPVEDHSLRLIDHQAPTCVDNGYNKFKCDEPTCPYYDVITEVIAATEHDLVHHDAKTATCTEGGYGAYDTCTKCDYSTYDSSTASAPLGHTYVSKGYIAPTCTEEGCTDAIVCDRCGYIHHQGESIAPLGHHLVDVAAVPATCTEKGTIAHKKCTVCGKLFATTVENEDIDAQPLSSVDIPASGHKYNTIVINPTCTDGGYTCTRCEDTYVDDYVDALGHSFGEGKICTECGYMSYTPGWNLQDGSWYYVNEDGSYKTGWLWLNNTWYYLNEDGVMQTGWLMLGDDWYYLNEYGVMQTGWLSLGDNWYYLNEGGAMHTGWLMLGSNWYYLNEYGAMQTGWLRLGDNWYYLNEGGDMHTGWLRLNNTWYYMNDGGAMATGWLRLGDNWYYLNNGGDMHTGWLYLNNTWYYLEQNGVWIR